jgi:NADH-quinone oxidoreductase E subunit
MSSDYSKVSQPETFEFSARNQKKFKAIFAKYPKGREASAMMPLLDLAQRQHDGWLPRAAMDHIADILNMAPIRVYEVATFYTMYNLAPVGENHLQVCTNLPCWLRGSDKIMSLCKENLGIGAGETTKDGKFTLSEVECLCACVNAPMMQINDDFYEDLDEDSTVAILESIKSGVKPTPGPQNSRTGGEPEGGATTLIDNKVVTNA